MQPDAAPRATKWAYTPELPLEPAPFLRWPIRPDAIVRHLFGTWSPLTSRFIMLIAAWIVWRWFSPNLQEADTFAFGWVANIWFRNGVILMLSAGLPHLVLYKLQTQGSELRYDDRPLGRNKRIFLFDDQVKDNIFRSVVGGLTFWTLWEALAWWSYANGYLQLISFESNPVWFVVLIMLVPVYSVQYFGVVHWLLHRGPAYRHVHSVHHKNVNVGPWSGLAMHPLEHFLLFSDVIVFFLLPSSPLHLLFAMMHHGIGAPMSHTGYDGIRLTRSTPSRNLTLRVGDFHHQLHHRFIECNYGGLESPLDDLIDAFHDGTAAGDQHIRERRRRLAGR